MLRALKRRNFAGENGIYDVRYHQLNRPSFLVGVRTCKFLVRVGKLTLTIIRCISIY
ncbi:uncharacterized protein B0T23DRAFT_327457 [Neurospora hispaniola]|uniref:Uncharacterized protein n=1 Tax=Neurospora hispaniola TaxID=588809 RepID=A0AAJ0HYE5_9PEZI|nr:hypothetical protein B0T23DRAFT_327457 [Neurospora hispaniola]